MHSRTLRRVAPRLRRYYASRDAARAESFRRELDGAGAFGGYDEALRDAPADVALVATPPASHLELTLLALETGRHVIVEKPPFLRAADFDSVEHAAAAAGRQVMVAENYFYRPILTRLRQVVRSGDLGAIRLIHVNALKRQHAADWRNEHAQAGGGALFEGGIHWIDFMANLGLEPRAAHGFRPGDAALERSMLVVFEYEGGAVGTLSYSWEIHSPMKGLRLSRVFGTDGGVVFESNGLFLCTYGRRFHCGLPGLRDIAGYAPMFRDFLAALAEGRPPAFTLAHARRDMALLEQAYRSAGMTTNGEPTG